MLDNRSERYRALYKWITFVAGNIYISEPELFQSTLSLVRADSEQTLQRN